MIGSYSGTSITAGQKFISTDSSGALTFTFYSDYSVYSSGWDATITCVQLPKISNFLPSSICVGATPLVTITGVNFTGTTTVKFNGVAASSFTVVNSTTITAIFPTGGTTGPITLSNGTDSNDSVANFQVNAYPAAPNAGPDVSICTGNSTTLSGTSVSNSTTTVLSQDFNAGPWPAGWSRPLGDYRTSFEYVSSGNTWPPNGYTGYCSYFWTYVTSAGVSDDMITPLMDLSSYTTANLTFWIYNSDGTDTLKVYANNNGGAYTQVGSTYATYGSWTQITISLNSFVGSVFTDVRLKFTGTSDYGFSNIGIDDIVVTGNVSATYVWSPSTGLSSTTILAPTANPTTTTIYTLTTTNPAGCSISDDVVVTVIPIVAGVASSSQTICGGSPADLTLTGSSGTIQWQYADNLAFNVNVNPIAGANSATLTSAQMGLLAANRYYRAVLTNGICTLYSNIITITISGSSTTWNSGSWSNGSPDATKAAIFNGPYTSSGDISACSISVTALGSVTILTGHTVTVQNVVSVNSSGSLIFQDGSSLVQPNAVTNSAGVYSGGNVGNITYMRTASPMFKFDYTYWSSPVYPQNLLAFSPLTPLFYQYDGITANQWQYTNASATTMVVGKGYLARAPSNFPVYVTPIPPPPAAFTGSFVGVPNNGSQSVQIGVAQGVNQFNLIGNPYPSAVLADSFISANPNVGALYFWTHNTNINQTTYLYTNNDYAVYTLLGGTGTVKSPNSGAGISTKPLGNIAAGQGFFTKGVASITGAGPNYYATFTNAMRIAGNNTQFFKTTGPVTQNNNPFEKHRYWLDISNTEGAFREVLVGYVETATLGFDRLFDGQMSESSNVLSMYTLVEGKKMAIQGRPLPFDINDTVPLCYKSSIASTYTVSLPDYDGLFTSQHVYLEDTLLHVIHDLRVSPYTFVTEIGTFESRFILRYTTATLGTSTSLFNENSVIVYKNEHGLFINSGASIMHAVKIFDIRGRLIASREGINATTTSFTTLPTTQQVLLVQITSEEGVSVTKKVVY